MNRQYLVPGGPAVNANTTARQYFLPGYGAIIISAAAAATAARLRTLMGVGA